MSSSLARCASVLSARPRLRVSIHRCTADLAPRPHLDFIRRRAVVLRLVLVRIHRYGDVLRLLSVSACIHSSAASLITRPRLRVSIHRCTADLVPRPRLDFIRRHAPCLVRRRICFHVAPPLSPLGTASLFTQRHSTPSLCFTRRLRAELSNLHQTVAVRQPRFLKPRLRVTLFFRRLLSRHVLPRLPCFIFTLGATAAPRI